MADTTALKNRIRAAIKANDNQEITGPVLQQTLLDIVDELDLYPELDDEAQQRQNADTTLNNLITDEAQQRQNADTTLNNLITGIKNNTDNGYVYAGIATPSTNPVSGKVFYIAMAEGTYTNFGGQVLTQGINILRYNGSSWSHQQLIGIDDVPTVASNSLVKSGGVQNELALGAVYDVSAKNPTAGPNNDGKWESLSALLSDANLNTLIPTAYRKGGMSIKFVQSSDMYMQYRLTTNEWSTAVANWQEDGDTYTKNSVQSSDLDLSDNDGNVLVRFADGHIKTKNFDSAKNSFSEENASKLNSIEQGAEVNNVTIDDKEDADLNISDEEGNVLIQAKNGHIRTKYFDSAKIGFNRYNLSSNVLGFNRCPDIWTEEYDYLLAFVYGQSFTIVDDGGYKVTDEFDKNLYIFEDNQLKPINTSWWSDEEYLPISAMNIISKVCRKYGKKAPQFIIINVGKGNRTCLELMKESSIRQLLTNEEWTTFSNLPTYENRYSAVTSNLAALKTWATTNNKKIICPFFMFLQGESDTHSDLSGHGSISCSNGDYNTYKERLSIMLSDLKADIIDATEQDVAPAAFIDNIGNGVFKDALSGISQAQTDVTIEMDGVYSCGPYYAYPMYAAHPTPDGRRWIGEVLAKLFYNTFIGCRNSKMFISSYKVEGNNVILNILSPCPPLVIDDYTSEEENMCGFKAYDLNMDEITIKSIEVSCSQVVLELASIPSSDFYISYGGSGYGNIRDSSNWNACYKYESNALGDEHSIAHYPKDKEGNAIIGQYYPMWNWLPCSFIEITN